MKKGSLAAKKWGARMRALRNKVKVRVKSTRKKRISRQGGIKMARRRRSSIRRRSSSRKSFGVGGIMRKGLINLPSVAIMALAGIAAANVSSRMLPQAIPYQKEVAALAVGGIPGVVGSFVVNGLASGTASNGITLY